MWFKMTYLPAFAALLVAGCGGSNSGTPTQPAAPAVASVTPASGTTAVATTTAVTATFTQPMNASTINSSTFTLTGPGGAIVAGTVAYNTSASVATFTPAANLGYSTQYTATIATGAEDSGGTALAANYTWSFTTAVAPATPTVASVSPSAGSTGVAANTAITATFSEAMNASTINSSTFAIAGPGGAAVGGTVTYSASGSIATFTPGAQLAYNTTFTATITTGAQDTSGVALQSNYTWTFTTGQAPPQPAVVATVPANGATSVAVNQPLTATFNQEMNPATLDSATFTLATAGGATVAGVVTYSAGSSTATFTPATALAYNTSYTATITTAASSTAGGALGSPYVWTFTTSLQPSNMATVDFGSANQTIRGFGGSTAWMPEMPTNVANTLFGSGANQLGLSILRVRIDPSGSPSNNWITTNWATEAGNAQEAIAANPNALVIATPWTPPASMKSNSSIVGGTLNSTSYAAYATYLEDFVQFMSSKGVNLHAISMQNEPDANVTYESCSWTGATMDSWVANNASVLTASLIMPESESFNTSYSDPALNDASAVGRIAIVAGHIYGKSPFYYTNAENQGKEVWMTEHYLSPSGTQPGIADALLAAKEVNDSLSIGNYNAYLWWWVADWNAGSGVTNYGLVDASGNPTFYGYALGQYAQFVQPGYVRVNAAANPSANVYLTAFKGNGHSVIVAINLGTTSVTQPFMLLNSGVTAITPYQTTASGGLSQQSPVSVADGPFSYTLPAQSITTFVQ